MLDRGVGVVAPEGRGMERLGVGSPLRCGDAPRLVGDGCLSPLTPGEEGRASRLFGRRLGKRQGFS